MFEKFKSKQKAVLYLYLGAELGLENIYWFLINKTEIIHQGKGMSAALYELTKDYKTYAIIRGEKASLVSIEAPVSIKASDYPLFLEDEVLEDLTNSHIILFDKQKSEFQGQILSFAILDKQYVQNWQNIFAEEKIFFQNFYLDLGFLKNLSETKVLIFKDLEGQSLFVFKNSTGALNWLVWQNDFLNKLPPNLQKILENSNIKITEFKNTNQRMARIFEDNSTPLVIKVAKVKSNLEFGKKLAFLKNIKKPSLNFLKKPIFWFFAVFLSLMLAYFVLQNQIAEKTAIAQFTSVNSLKMNQNISTQELVDRIESGAKNYPLAKTRINKIYSILNRVNSRLSNQITPLEIYWDKEKLVFLLSLSSEEDLESLQGLTKKLEFLDFKAKLEFNLN